jgi:hypothetical protein
MTRLTATFDDVCLEQSMRLMKRYSAVSLAVAILASGTLWAEDPLPKRVQFNRDIRPILSNHCFACHGPDEGQRQTDLRFDVEESAFAELDSGVRALVPGDLKESEVYRRITSDDEFVRMPPPDFGKPLSERKIALLEKWIKDGAKWEPHWNQVRPRRGDVPSPVADWHPRGAIDRFIQARLQEEEMAPAPEADRRTLIRRLYFDLTGLPPTNAEVEAFVNDDSPGAYEELVDRLLSSKHFGERMALWWLDLVRYADSIGYHSDNPRDVWMYREWVIDAFNEDMPFDRFTVEQLAGDLLPEATDETRIASGYNMLLQTTQEGGAQAKEYMAKYSADRVRNVSEVWLGATMGCAECHDHKYDPYTQRDFYSMAAFFADIQEPGVGRRPHTRMPTPEQAARLKELNDALAKVEKPYKEAEAAVKDTEKVLKELSEKRKAGEKVAKEPEEKGKDAERALKQLDEEVQAAKEKQKAAVAARDAAKKPYDKAKKERDAFQNTIPQTLLAVSGNPRTIHILPRGNWQDDSGPVVEPDTPAFMKPLGVKDRRATRLDLARWLLDPQNPMTSRAQVNRFWKLLFGHGIARTLDDLGGQGEWPTHPKLLDWLAVEFIECGWDVKHMVKLMVMSQTYRQSSQGTPELRQRDPDNRLFARQSRFHLDAEFVRDNALQVSGLLVKKIGGPSVFPYQPAGYWQHLNFPTRKWPTGKGDELYRRGLYTHWQRTFLHPSLLAFDATSREECTAERPRSNTPQQALALLNDPTFVEAARVLATKILREGGDDAAARLNFAFETVLQRDPTDDEADVLQKLHAKHLAEYRADEKSAGELLQVGEAPSDEDLDAAELAAWTSVARVLLNLHEMITRY